MDNVFKLVFISCRNVYFVDEPPSMDGYGQFEGEGGGEGEEVFKGDGEGEEVFKGGEDLTCCTYPPCGCHKHGFPGRSPSSVPVHQSCWSAMHFPF